MEQALKENRRDRWPLVVLNLDFKTNEPEHHAAVLRVLERHAAWLTTGQRTATPDNARPAEAGPAPRPDRLESEPADRLPRPPRRWRHAVPVRRVRSPASGRRDARGPGPGTGDGAGGGAAPARRDQLPPLGQFPVARHREGRTAARGPLGRRRSHAPRRAGLTGAFAGSLDPLLHAQRPRRGRCRHQWVVEGLQLRQPRQCRNPLESGA